MTDLKQSDRDRIAAQTEAFLRQGGEIKIIPTDVWGQPPDLAGMSKERADKARERACRHWKRD